MTVPTFTAGPPNVPNAWSAPPSPSSAAAPFRAALGNLRFLTLLAAVFCAPLMAANPLNPDVRINVLPIYAPMFDPAGYAANPTWTFGAGRLSQETPEKDGNPGFLITAFLAQVGGSRAIAQSWPNKASDPWWNHTTVTFHLEVAIVEGRTRDHQTKLHGGVIGGRIDFCTILLETQPTKRAALGFLYGFGMDGNLLIANESPAEVDLNTYLFWVETGFQADFVPFAQFHLEPYLVLRAGIANTHFTRPFLDPGYQETHGFVLPYGGVMFQWNGFTDQPENGIALDLSLAGADSPRWVMQAELRIQHLL